MDTINFYKALRGEKLSSSIGDITFTTHYLGELILTSGRLVACDPLAFPDSEAFQKSLPIGKYPVFLIVAHYPKNNDQRVAYAIIRIREQTPVNWKLGICSDEELDSLTENDTLGYPVDSGVGCFMDFDAVKILDDSIHYAYIANPQEESLIDLIQDELRKNYRHTWKWANICIDKSTQLNIIAFSSGYGDGCYPTYFGYDTEDKIVNIVTEF